MRNNLLGAILVTVLFTCAVGTAWLSFRYVVAAREVVRLQVEMRNMVNVIGAAQKLAAEATDYGKRNPAINAILQQYGLQTEMKIDPSAASPPASQPATK